MKTFNEFVNEEIRQKPMLGKGKEHHVFDFEKDPTKVIKVAWDTENGNRYDSSSKRIITDLDPEHIDMFVKFPDVFAKVFKRTKRYTIIEKLDTKRPKLEEKQLFDLVDKYKFPYLEYIHDNDAINVLYWQITHRTGLLTKMIKKMTTNNEDLTLFNFYVDFFKKINGGLKKYFTRKGIDVGSYNIGYDKDGNLKLLDF